MSTLSEIERADALPPDQQKCLLQWLSARLGGSESRARSAHSVLDIAPVSLGRMIDPPDDDLLGMMLEEHQ